MATNIRDSVSSHVSSLRQHYRPLYPVVLAGLLGTGLIGRIAWNDYKLFLSYGPGGVPYNPLGWLLTTLLRPIGINMVDVKKFTRDPDQRTWFSEDWRDRPRSGARPNVGPHPIPQRQLDQHAPGVSQNVRRAPVESLSGAEPWKFLQNFASLVQKNSDIVEFKLSGYERHTDAIYVKDDSPVFTIGKAYRREISHIHTNTDYSAHVILSPRDTATVIQSGWGQLHALAGVGAFAQKGIPSQYVLLYAPRNDEEVEVLIDIIKAGIGYMTDSRDVKSP